ncbi:lipopolysaccharide biosynthesis protein [Leptothoe sp. PORK10 BA2]|uniref:lipopolysaccharide biosynthesis protein n=1 Tax=Leptothoe sp. PORK10 BA2 TaxID=3110254 RepID=UPI002B2092B9|nr:oligosaccharide flippase family protein [Leptothoe sp. PORK10 BA2]MEA5466507.1 oligosaccharide flippase family protein [Leptothoe sp. PORK10 BA2]
MIKDGLYNLVGAIFRMGVTVATIPLLIRLIGLEEYGVWTIVYTVIAIVTLAEAGLSVSTTFFLSRDIADQNEDSISQTLTVSFCAMIILASLAALLLCLGADYLVYLFPKLTESQHQTIVPAFRLAALVVWAKMLQRICVGIEQAYQCYGLFNLVSTLQVGVVNLGMVGVAYAKGMTLELMQWQIVTNLLFLLIHSVISFRLIQSVRLNFIWNHERCIEIFRYSLMTWLTSIGSTLFTQGDKLIVGSILSPSMLGVYAAITSITAQINALSALSVQPLLPQLSRLLQSAQFKTRELIKTIRQAAHINAGVSVGLGGGLLMLAPFVLKLLLPGVDISTYLGEFYAAIIIYTLYSLNAVGYYILFSTDNVNFCLKTQIFSGLTSLILITLGANTFGLWGAILGNAAYNCIWLLTYKAMFTLNISISLWVRWFAFAGFWFGLISALAFLLPNSLYLRLVVVVIHTLVLLYWFYTHSHLNFKFAS